MTNPYALPGPRNLITDVAGLKVGNAHDDTLRSGVTVLTADAPFVASVDVRGGAPGTRETDFLSPNATVAAIDAIALSGGSAYGLSAADGVMAALAAKGRGFTIGTVRVPLVSSAIIFDLLNGGNKLWGAVSPYPALGAAAVGQAADQFALGNTGAGLGATTATLKGGLGSASCVFRGITVGALVVVNAVGSATIGVGPHFWAAPFEVGDEFGRLGLPHPFPADAAQPRLKGSAGQNTTIAIVATDAALDKAALQRLAIMAQDGLARALYPVHTPLDGDVVFAVSTGQIALADLTAGMTQLGIAAANTLSRAVARGVYEAASLPDTAPPAWRDLFA